VAGSCSAAWWHGLCNMRIVSARSFHVQSVRPFLPSVNGGVRSVHRVPPLSNAASQRLPSGRPHVVCPKLSRSDFVQLLNVGKSISLSTLQHALVQYPSWKGLCVASMPRSIG
jgi:hypothetical protein